MSKQSPPNASAIGPCPTIIQTVGRPALEARPLPFLMENLVSKHYVASDLGLPMSSGGL